MRNWLRAISVALILVSGLAIFARSDYSIDPGSTSTVFSFSLAGPKILPATVVVSSDGTGIPVATSTAQTTGNASLSTIATNTTGVTQGSATSGLSAALIVGNTTAGNAVVPYIDPCQANVPVILPFSITTATTTNILSGTALKKIYVCYLYMQTAAANNIAIIQGTTGGTCGSGTATLGPGSTTAANGMNNAANSGQALGTGGFFIMQTTANQNDICLITSASTPLAGLMRYVVQ